MKPSLAEQLQLWGFEGDFAVFTDGSTGFGLDCCPIDIQCANDAGINGLAKHKAQFLNGLPEGIDIQFLQEIVEGNDSLVADHENLLHSESSEMVKNITKMRAEKLRRLDTEGSLPVHKLRIFVRKPLSKPLVGKSSIFSRVKLFPELAEDRLKHEVRDCERLRKDLCDSLESLGLRAKPFRMEEMLDLVYEQWNPLREVSRPSVDPEDVREGIVYTDANLSESGFSLGAMRHRVLSLKQLPEQTVAGMAEALRRLPFNSRLFVTIHVPEQAKELENLKTQRRIAYSLAYGKQGVRDLEGEAKFQDLEDLIQNMVTAGEKVFHVGLNVVLRATTERELEDQVSKTLLLFRELNGAEGMVESLAAFDIFSEFSIPNARVKERQKRLKTSNLADLLPIYGPWPGHPQPSILLRSRMGSLVSFDPFSSELTSANQILSGGSGAGKSYLANILMLQMLKEQPKVYIVDIGGSYKKLCENLDGQYVPFGVDAGYALNPFDLAAGETTPSSHKIKFLMGLVEIMAKEDDATRLPKYERATIEEAIQRVYADGGERNLSHLKRLLEATDSPEIRRYGKILGPWCGQTPYGAFFDRDTTIELKRPIVCFDLKGLEEFPDLQAACLYIITDFVWREVQRDRVSKKFLIMDECWRLLENDAGASFIGEVYRTFRKYRASAVAISQNVDDFAQSRVSTAIIPNAPIKWILMQRGADESRLKTVLSLNDNELSLVRSLRQERGEYSEAFLIAGERRTVVAIESTPLEYWIATTDPVDIAKIEEEKRNDPSCSNHEILRALSLRYPKGVSASRVAEEAA